jgi:predicted DNA-binding transcriptional regulator YafY
MQMSRLFEILYILLDKKTLTARELAERFEVSQRTIYRDIDALNLAGIPVYTSKGKGGGIGLLEDFVLDKSILSEREQNEILSALQSLRTMKASENSEVLQKLSALFHKSTANWLEVDFSDWSYGGGDIFSLLKTAILEKRIAEFDYYGTDGQKTHRRIEPVQLWFKHRVWYVKAFCLAKQGLRLFRLTRIQNPVLTEEPFAERSLLQSPAQDPSVQQQKGRNVALKLRIRKEMAYRVYDEFAENQVERNADGSYTATVTWPEDEWVYGFLLSFGEYLEVLEPQRIRGILREKLQKAARQYG